MDLPDHDPHRFADVVHGIVPDSVLDQAVHVDRHHALASRGHTARAERIGESVVLKLIP